MSFYLVIAATVVIALVLLMSVINARVRRLRDED
jgi:uncharacterized membrane protein YhaH (DUF805 family)